MWAAEPAPTGPPWVQTLIAVVAVIGGGGGLAALATVVLQKRKFKADAADVLTDTALTLLDPLKAELRDVRSELAAAKGNVVELSDTVSGLTAVLRRWRAAILSMPVPAREQDVLRLREMVTSERFASTAPGRELNSPAGRGEI